MLFDLKVMRKDGTIVSLRLEAANEVDARAIASNQELAILGIRPGARFGIPTTMAGTNKFPLFLFSRELRVLLAAGIPLVETLETLAEREQKPAVQSTLKRLVELLKEGRPLSDGMAQLPEIFPPLYSASIRASEKSGEIVAALDRYLAYQAQSDAVRKKIVSASVYPVLLLGFGGLVLLFLMGYVVPKFSQIYQDHAGNISYASKLLLGWGQMIAGHGREILGYAAAIVTGLWLWSRQPATRARMAAWVRTWPWLGERIRIFQLARLYRTLSMLLRGGMPAMEALQMASGILEPGLRKHLMAARHAVNEGLPLSDAFSKHGLSTQVALRFIRVGEQSGSMSDMMENAAAFHEEELARDVDVFTKLFEPALMMAMGLLIGTVVLLMYLPIFELASAIE